MKNNVVFEDNYVYYEELVTDKALQFLEEACGELESQVKRNTAVDTGQLKNSWEHVIDESKMIGIVGSAEENAIWEEFGTGEYALHGDGRKTPWKYKHYKYGWLTTTGKKPRRALEKGKNASKAAIKARAIEIFKEIGE